jgi:hypothetical protein
VKSLTKPLVAIVVVMSALLAAPAHGQSEGSCSPAPCAGTDPAQVTTGRSTIRPPESVLGSGPTGRTSPAPVVGIGLLMVGVAFTVMAFSRWAVIRRTTRELLPAYTGERVSVGG